jgi:hypothetical protein
MAAELDASLPHPALALCPCGSITASHEAAAGLSERPCRWGRQRSLFLLFLQEIISGH